MPVITVNGEISPDDLGITDIHEHILCDFSGNHEPQEEPAYQIVVEQPVCMENLGVVTQNPLAIKDNLILSDEAVALSELAFFKKAGGRTIVDPTTIELGRNPTALRSISSRLDLHIIISTGHYIQQYHAPSIQGLSVDAIISQMLEEIIEGIADTGVRAGIIGELGTGEQIYPDEEKVLTAAAGVNKSIGVPIMVHTDPQHRMAAHAINILTKGGANPQKISICHMDSNFFEWSYYRQILSTGVFIEFDTFGEHFCLHPNYGPSDLDRIKTLHRLIDEGFVSQIMLGNDVCLKCRLHAYGGWGYDHLLSNVVPAMKRLGISDAHIKTMLIGNPRRYLVIGS